MNSPLYQRMENKFRPLSAGWYPLSKRAFVKDVARRWIRARRVVKLSVVDYNLLIDTICDKYRAHSNTKRSARQSLDYWHVIFFDKDGQFLRMLESPEEQAIAAVKSANSRDIEFSSLLECDLVECESCGKFTPMCTMNAADNGGYYHARSTNEWWVCGGSRCQAIAKNFKRGRSKFPLINIIKEVTKYANKPEKDNENKRRLAEYFVRDARRVPKQRNRPHSSQNSGEAVRQLA